MLVPAPSPFRNKRCLITGGAGFIGSNLARRLVGQQAQVTLVDSLYPQYGGNLFNIREINDALTITIADVRDEDIMAKLIQGQDFLFNLAGQTSHTDSMLEPFTDLEINCRAQLSILEACHKHNPGVKIVYTSTRQIYGSPDYLPVDEKHPLHPADVNGINKMAGEWYHILYNNVYGIRAVSLRLTNTYGPCMRVKDARQTFLGIWLRKLIQGQSIDVFGDGLQLRDFNFVDDVIDAILAAACSEAANGKIYNLGSDEVISLKDLAQLLVQINNGGQWQVVPFPPERKAIDIGDYYANWQLAHAELGWSPHVSLKDGLQRTLNYYRQHAEHYW